MDIRALNPPLLNHRYILSTVGLSWLIVLYHFIFSYNIPAHRARPLPPCLAFLAGAPGFISNDKRDCHVASAHRDAHSHLGPCGDGEFFDEGILFCVGLFLSPVKVKAASVLHFHATFKDLGE